MKIHARILLIIAFYACGHLALAQPCVNKIIFEDNFDQPDRIPDPAKWGLCPTKTPPWARFLSESYDQAYVENGKLILKAEKAGNTYKTGGIQTKGFLDFLYGKVEVNAKFVRAKGAWPAIWMLPEDRTGNWPTCGEIDIMEQLNHDNIVYQTVHNHYKNDLNFNSPAGYHTAPYDVDKYNTYAVEWTPEELEFSVNGKTTFTYPNLHLADSLGQWPYNKPFYLILNCALGGENTWPGSIIDTELPACMMVDWVKITQKGNEAQPTTKD